MEYIYVVLWMSIVYVWIWAYGFAECGKKALCEVHERRGTKKTLSWPEMRLKGQEEDKMWNIRKCSWYSPKFNWKSFQFTFARWQLLIVAWNTIFYSDCSVRAMAVTSSDWRKIISYSAMRYALRLPAPNAKKICTKSQSTRNEMPAFLWFIDQKREREIKGQNSLLASIESTVFVFCSMFAISSRISIANTSGRDKREPPTQTLTNLFLVSGRRGEFLGLKLHNESIRYWCWLENEQKKAEEMNRVELWALYFCLRRSPLTFLYQMELLI